MSLSDNLKRVSDRIASAAERSGRSALDVTLVAVSKTRSAAEVEAAIRAGLKVFGENRVQEAEAKIVAVRLPAEWHLVGHLQRNKVKAAVGRFELIHSVDSVRLAKEIGKTAVDSPRRVLVQVNVTGEMTKSGFSTDEAVDRLGEIGSIQGVAVEGLMTIGVFDEDVEKVRPGFVTLRRLAESIERSYPRSRMQHLSMGMTNDFEAAIEEGATMVRLGTAIFGERPG